MGNPIRDWLQRREARRIMAEMRANAERLLGEPDDRGYELVEMPDGSIVERWPIPNHRDETGNVWVDCWMVNQLSPADTGETPGT